MFNEPEGNILWHKPMVAGVSICDSSLLTICSKDEHFFSHNKDVSMPVCIANLVIDALSAARKYMGHDVQ